MFEGSRVVCSSSVFSQFKKVKMLINSTIFFVCVLRVIYTHTLEKCWVNIGENTFCVVCNQQLLSQPSGQ